MRQQTAKSAVGSTAKVICGVAGSSVVWRWTIMYSDPHLVQPRVAGMTRHMKLPGQRLFVAACKHHAPSVAAGTAAEASTAMPGMYTRITQLLRYQYTWLDPANLLT
jgi:hypothetical protein